MTTQNFWDAAKPVLRWKFIAIQSYLRKQEKHWIDNLALHLKQLGKEQQQQKQTNKQNIVEGNKSYRSSRNKWKRNERNKRLIKVKAGFSEKTNKIDKPLARFIKKKREENQINKLEIKKERL